MWPIQTSAISASICGFTYVSPAAATICGHTPGEFYADPDLALRLTHPDDRALLDAAQEQRETSQMLTLRWVRKDGRVIWVEQRSVPVFDGAGGLIAQEAITRDVTLRQQSEERIQRQLSHIQALRAIDTAIVSSLDRRITLNILLEQVTSQLGVDATAILLNNAHTQTLEYAAGRGFRSTAAQRMRLRLGEGYAGRTALERRTQSHAISASDPHAPNWMLSDERFVGYWGVPLIAKGQVKGVLEVYCRTTLEPDADWVAYLETLAGQAVIAVDNIELFDGLQRSNVELALAYDATIEGWSKAMDLRDKATEGHSQRVSQLTLQLARATGHSDEEMAHIHRGALLHDVGKLGIPDGQLLKPGPLTDEEWGAMRQHPVYAYEWLAPISYLRAALDIPYCHHEKWDGSGYPRGLKGEAIPMAARLFAVADVYDALTSDRPYRRAWTRGQTLDYIREQAGKHFDPQVVEVFMRLASEGAV